MNFKSKKCQQIFAQICFKLEEYREELTFHDFYNKHRRRAATARKPYISFYKIAVLLENLSMNSGAF